MRILTYKFLRGEFREKLPYLLIILLGLLTYSFNTTFLSINFDGFYGKRVSFKAYDFSLLDLKNNKVRLSDYQNKFVLMSFGFSQCTDVCPLNLHKFEKISKKLALNSKIDLSYLFISFDNIRDGPEQMTELIQNFKISKIEGLISGEETGLFVARKFNNYIRYEEEKITNSKDYQISHNGFLYLIDPLGDLALIYMQRDIDINRLISDIDKLTNEYK